LSSARQDWVRARGCYGIRAGDSSRSLPLSDVVSINGGHCGPKVLAACRSRRSVVVHLRGIGKARVRNVSVYVNGRRVRVQRGNRRTVRLSLAGHRRGTARVRFVVTIAGGRTVTDRRTYRVCSKPGG
jgi:hypothetical protein